VESQTPSGPKPPLPPETSNKSDTVWISPRLREKLREPDDEGPRQGSSPLVGIILAVLVIGGGGGLFLSMRSGAVKQRAAAEEKARLAAAAATAESIATGARLDSMRMADTTGAHTASGAAARPAARATASAAKPAAGASASASKPAAGATASAVKPAPARPTSPTASAPKSAAPAAAAAPAEKGPFGLDVGTFLVEDRAGSEQARLATATGLAGKVVTRNEDGGDVYHVVLGSFPSRAAAEKRAESLVAKGLVNQARAVPLGR
jgi:cell division septation protein DedD